MAEAEFKDYKAPVNSCPHCGYITEMALEMQPEAEPSAGDVSLCLACCGLSLFTDDLKLRLPTKKEIIAMRLSPSWAKVIQATAFIRNLPDGPKPPRNQ